MSCLLLRTLVVAPWLLALLIHAKARLGPAVLALALVSVWAVPLARDCRRRGRTRFGVVPAHPSTAGGQHRS